MNKSIFKNIVIPDIKFHSKDRALTAFSEIKTIDNKKYIVTYLWENQKPIVINILSRKEYIFKNIESCKTTSCGNFKNQVSSCKRSYFAYIGYDVTCKNKNKNELISFLDEKVLNNYYISSNNDNTFQVIEQYIEHINTKKEDAKKEKLAKRDDFYFNKFKTPKFPKGFTEFCEKWIDENDRLFISKNRRNGEYKGYCTHCGCKNSLTNYYFVGYNMTCPYCGENIEVRFDRKDDTQIMFVANVGYFEKINGEVAVRLFHIYRRDRGVRYGDLSEKDFKEYARYVITDKKVFYWQCEYRYGMGNHWDECAWYSAGFRVFDGYFTMYNNLKSLKIKTPLLKFNNIIERRAHTDTDLFKILSTQRKYPCIEYLQAQGWNNLVGDIIGGKTLKMLNPKGVSASAVFGIEVNKVKKYGNETNMMQLFIIKLADKLKLSINKEVIDYFNKFYDIKKQAQQVEKLFKYIKPIKFVNYAKARNIGISDYSDYIDQLLVLNYDMESEINLYPRDFRESHTELSALITAQQKKIFETAVETMYENYHNLCEWSKDGLTVMMAKNCAEIIKEGMTQNHCVGNYCERVAKGESIILFLRRTGVLEQGFYTMEIRPDMRKLNLIQCRGYGNQDPSEDARAEVDAFLAKYEKWFNRRSTQGLDKNKIYSKYYKAVKKTEDGRYLSAWDNKTEYVIGKTLEGKLCTDPDRVAANGIHIASLEFAQNYGNNWKDVAILEVEVNINDVIVPDAKDQIRASKVRVLREVPMTEMGEWGKQHASNKKATKKVA